MSRSSFRELLSRASSNPGQESYNPLYRMVEGGGVGEGEVYDELKDAIARRDWTAAGILLDCISIIDGSSRFAPVLSNLLDSDIETIDNEGIVDLLDSMHDENSIPALRRAVFREFPRDTLCYWTNRKALQALATFEDSGAWDTIRMAAESSNTYLREEAQRLIREREPGFQA